MSFETAYAIPKLYITVSNKQELHIKIHFLFLHIEKSIPF